MDEIFRQGWKLLVCAARWAGGQAMPHAKDLTGRPPIKKSNEVPDAPNNYAGKLTGFAHRPPQFALDYSTAAAFMLNCLVFNRRVAPFSRTIVASPRLQSGGTVSA
jgi:hypothetical protein